MSPDPLPWYRHFWPWFIIVLLSGAVLGSCVSAYLAIHGNDVVLDHSDMAG